MINYWSLWGTNCTWLEQHKLTIFRDIKKNFIKKPRGIPKKSTKYSPCLPARINPHIRRVMHVFREICVRPTSGKLSSWLPMAGGPAWKILEALGLWSSTKNITVKPDSTTHIGNVQSQAFISAGATFRRNLVKSGHFQKSCHYVHFCKKISIIKRNFDL